MSFEALKRNRANDLSRLVAAAADTDQQKTTKSYVDERQWKPTVDKAGNGYAVLRFLPAPEGTDLPWSKFWDHGFKGPTGQWYIEKSLTSLGQQDPVSEANSKLWNSGDDRDKDIARERKRRLHYVSNVLIESDPSNPANEGQVMLFTYGKKIHDKIMDVMNPEYPDEKPMNPFDFWSGASFKLKIRKFEGYRNYDKSEFDSPSELSADESFLEETYSKLYDLGEFSDPAQFKSYEELSARLQMVLGESAPAVQAFRAVEEVQAPAPVREAPAPSVSAADEDDTMSYFAKLAEED
jgi:hypothetical protein